MPLQTNRTTYCINLVLDGWNRMNRSKLYPEFLLILVSLAVIDSKKGEKDRKITNFIEISLFFSFWALSPKNSNRYSSFVFRATDPIFSDKLLMGYTIFLSDPDFGISAFWPPFWPKNTLENQFFGQKGGQNAEIPDRTKKLCTP